MYVSYETFVSRTIAEEFPTEEEYARLAPVADLVVDEWTMGRVGRTVADGDDLPDPVVTLYCAVVESIPGAVQGGKASGELVKSFSNGVDKFEFEDGGDAMARLERSCMWMLGLLPVEWVSRCVGFEGGIPYAG